MSKTVRELKAELDNYPDDFIVIQAKDPEGNGYHEWYDIGTGKWDEDAHYDDAFTSWTYDDDEDTSTERELTLDESNCIVLWP